MTSWSTRDITFQNGRLAVITGATGGLGYETAMALAAAGTSVVLTGRNPAKGNAAIARIHAVYPRASVRYEALDLGSLESVHQFADRFASQHVGLDMLINNGGVMAPPTRQVTADGFELQFGTNYLAHFALTARLLPQLRRGRQARVVNLSSVAHRFGASIAIDDLQWVRRYRSMAAYSQSMLAMLMFTFELQRRSDANGWGLFSVAAHPGYASTGLPHGGPRLDGAGRPGLVETLSNWLEPLLAQPPELGALPILFAATSPRAHKAGYYGPTGFMELKGDVGSAIVARRARDPAVAAWLWNISDKLAHVDWISASGATAPAPVVAQREWSGAQAVGA
jgi:NAD(P)-dependent dehydrogenase (short-subunit alcohol dehydrogenase family)